MCVTTTTETWKIKLIIKEKKKNKLPGRYAYPAMEPHTYSIKLQLA